MTVTDSSGATVYESGYYDEAEATLYTDSSKIGFNRALGKVINAARGNNAVMVYEKRTGIDNGDGTYSMSVSLLNDKILFDNRIPPAGFTYADYQAAGTKFWSYDPATLAPYEDIGRFKDGTNFDRVTYIFSGPADPNAQLNARAEIYWQTHTREFMEHLKNQDDSTLRPEGPPSVLAPNYPLTPTYLSDSISQTTGQNFADLTDENGQALNDNWGGIADAAWLLTGKGAPLLLSTADTSVIAVPAKPVVRATPLSPFAIEVRWQAVARADFYEVQVLYGKSTTNATWDKLALVQASGAAEEIIQHDGLNVGKTYKYRVRAYNSAGSILSLAAKATTPQDLPLAPTNLQVAGVTDTTVTLSWFDQADNELGFRHPARGRAAL